MNFPTMSISSLFRYADLINMGILLPLMMIVAVCIIAFLRKKMEADTPLIIPVLISFLGYGIVIILNTAQPKEELSLLLIAHLLAWKYLSKKQNDIAF